MADLLNQAIYDRDFNELQRLLLEGVDPNDLSGSESPLKTVVQEYGKPEELELLLEYGADPNIDEGSGITVFTDIIFLILTSITGRDPDEEPEYFIPYLQLLLDYGVDMNKSESGHPSAIRAIRDWPTDYSHNAAWFRNRGIISNPHPNDIWASEQLNKIIQDILDEKNKYKTYLSKQRLSLGKTGLSKNVTDSIMGNLDYDTFNVIGENLLDNEIYDNDSFNRYYPEETYSEYRQAVYGDDSKDQSRKIRRKNKKTKKKHNKKKWGRAQRGGNGTDLESDSELIRGMDRIPYGIRNSNEMANELIKAVVKNDKRRIKQLLLLGADINSQNVNKMTALHAAILITKNINIIKFLLKNGANPNINGNGISMINSLMKIEMDVYTKKKIIELLIKYGAKVNVEQQRDRFGENLTLNDVEKRYLQNAKTRNKDDKLKRLNFSKLMSNRLGENALQPEEPENIDRIGKMIDREQEKQRDEELRGELISEYLQSIQSGGLNTDENQKIFTNLIEKIIKGDKNAVKNLIVNEKLPVNIKNNTGATPLLIASLYSKPEIVDILLELKADPNILTNSGKPIIPGVLLNVKNNKDKYKILQSLINQGADIELKIDGISIVDINFLTQSEKDVLTKLNEIKKNRQNNSENKQLKEIYDKQDKTIIETMLIQDYLKSL